MPTKPACPHAIDRTQFPLKPLSTIPLARFLTWAIDMWTRSIRGNIITDLAWKVRSGVSQPVGSERLLL